MFLSSSSNGLGRSVNDTVAAFGCCPSQVLRQAARLLEAENRQLHLRIAQVLAELNKLKGKDSKGLQLELEKLQRQLEQRNDKFFAASSSERREGAPEKPYPFDEPRPDRSLG